MAETVITDVLVIGGGAAASRAAVEAASQKVKVDLVDKGKYGHSGTSVPCLQGLASVMNPEDSPEIFFSDWQRSSGNIGDETLAMEAISQSRKVVESLEAIGERFMSNASGGRMFYRGAGHSVARGLTSRFINPDGPNTVTILKAEAAKRGVRFHEEIMIVRLLQNGDGVIGAIGINSRQEFTVFRAKAVILASGGANWIYPNVASELAYPEFRTTGDSYYLAFQAGAPLVDLEFTQFRECPPGAAKFGGRYLNNQNERFMERYDPLYLEKAPRAKVVEAVYREMMAGRGPIRWEVQGVPPEEAANAPWLAEGVKKGWVLVGIDFQRGLGGAHINVKAETPVKGLFAAGEASGGVQGAGRIQGAAFLETQVFGINAGKNAAALAVNSELKKYSLSQLNDVEKLVAGINGPLDPTGVSSQIRETMWEKVGVVRNGEGLKSALNKFGQIRQENLPRLAGKDILPALETANLLFTAEAIARSALAREESRGAQIRSDFPATQDAQWTKHVCLNNRNGEMVASTIPVAKK